MKQHKESKKGIIFFTGRKGFIKKEHNALNHILTMTPIFIVLDTR